MRTVMVRPARLVRALLALSFVVAAGCGGGSGSAVLPNNYGICDSNAGSIAVARPTSGYPSNGNSVEIVSSSQSDFLYGNPTAFDLLLTSNFSGDPQVTTSPLSLVPDTGGPHPYTTDFFYQGNISNGSLLPGRTYNVYLNAYGTGCTPGLVGQIFT